MSWWKQLICGDTQIQLNECYKEKDRYLKELGECREDLQSTVDARNNFVIENSELKKEVTKLRGVLKASNPTSVPTAQIDYRRHFVGQGGVVKFAKMDVREFISTRDYVIYNDIKRNKAFFSGNDTIDIVIPKLYALAKKNYNYKLDTQFGFGELWLTAYELREVGAGDCEDYSHTIGSYFAIAGIPSNNWFVSCGDARAGFGHSTVYARDSQGTWRHLNSTRPQYREKHLSSYPDKNDNSDKPGIKPRNFWFSFNDKIAIHKFEAPKAKQSFTKELGDKIEIKAS